MLERVNSGQGLAPKAQVNSGQGLAPKARVNSGWVRWEYFCQVFSGRVEAMIKKIGSIQLNFR